MCEPITIAGTVISDFEGVEPGERVEFRFEGPNGIYQSWISGHGLGEDYEFVVDTPAPVRPDSSSLLSIGMRGIGTSAMLLVGFWDCVVFPTARGIRFSVYTTAHEEPLYVRADTFATTPPRCDDCEQNWATRDLPPGWQDVEIPFEGFTGGTYPYDPSDGRGFAFLWANWGREPLPYEFWIDDLAYVF